MFALKTNVSIWGLFYVNNDKIGSSFWPRISTKFDRVQEHKLRGAQDVVRYHLKTDRGQFNRNSECIQYDIRILSLDEVNSLS